MIIKLIIGMMLLACGLVIAGKMPLGVLAVYACSVPLDYGLAVAGMSLGSGVSIGRMALVLLVAVAVVHGVKSLRQGCPTVRRLNELIGGFVVIIWVSSAWALDPFMSIIPAVVLTCTALLVVVIQRFVRSEGDLRKLMWMLGIAAMLSGAVGALQYTGVLSTVAFREVDDSDDKRGRLIEYRGGEGGFRYSGPCSKPTGYGVVLMGGIPALFHLLLKERTLLARLSAGGCLAMTCFGLVLSMSRTGLVSAVVSIGVMAAMKWLRGQLNRFVVIGTAVTAILLLYQMATRVSGVKDRVVAGFSEGGDNSSASRVEVMVGGLKAVQEYPLFGVGPQNMKISQLNRYGLAAHDAVSQVFGEWGCLAAIALAAVVVATWRMAGRLRGMEGGNGDLDIFVKASLVAALVQGLGTTVFDERSFWITIGICTAGTNIVWSAKRVGNAARARGWKWARGSRSECTEASMSLKNRGRSGTARPIA